MTHRETASGESGGATERAQEKVKHAASEARDRGADLLDEGKEKARELGHKAAETARSQGDQQRERVADGVQTFADALRDGSRDLPEGRREYEPFIDGVADRVEGISRYLREHDVDTLTRDARRFAREHTPLFLSGAFTLGMLGARFLKSSGDEAREAGHGRDVSRDDRWSTPYGGVTPGERTGMYGQGAEGTDDGGGYAV
jgi:vacuolar-type H+-ATPase subunit H